MKTIAGSPVTHPRREGVFTETPLTNRGRVVVGALAVAAVAMGIIVGEKSGTPPKPDQPTSAEVKANTNELKNISQLNGAELTLPGEIKLYASPDTASTVRAITDEGKLKGKTLTIKYAGITGGDKNNQHIWEAAELPDTLVKTTEPATTTKGQAERMVYFPIDSLDNLPHEVVDVYYQAGKNGLGGFAPQSGKNPDGTARPGDGGIAAMQTNIVELQ